MRPYPGKRRVGRRDRVGNLAVVVAGSMLIVWKLVVDSGLNRAIAVQQVERPKVDTRP